MANVEIKLHSSFIKAAMYNSEKEFLRLEIGDHWYYYYGVTKQKVARFRKATSKGRYFVNYIKGQYKSVKRKIR